MRESLIEGTQGKVNFCIRDESRHCSHCRVNCAPFEFGSKRGGRLAARFLSSDKCIVRSNDASNQFQRRIYTRGDVTSVLNTRAIVKRVRQK